MYTVQFTPCKRCLYINIQVSEGAYQYNKGAEPEKSQAVITVLYSYDYMMMMMMMYSICI